METNLGIRTILNPKNTSLQPSPPVEVAWGATTLFTTHFVYTWHRTVQLEHGMLTRYFASVHAFMVLAERVQYLTRRCTNMSTASAGLSAVIWKTCATITSSPVKRPSTPAVDPDGLPINSFEHRSPSPSAPADSQSFWRHWTRSSFVGYLVKRCVFDSEGGGARTCVRERTFYVRSSYP